METILRMLFPELEPMTSARVVALVVGTIAALPLLLVLARRWQSYWWTAMALLATAYASTALASWLAVRMFAGTLDELSKRGGGISTLTFGIWQATQLPLAAAWLAVVSSVVAALLLLRWRWRAGEGASPLPGGSALVPLAAAGVIAGIAPVLVFRRATELVVRAVIPGTTLTRHPMQFIMQQLATANAVAAFSFVVAVIVLLIIVARGRRPAVPRAFLVLTSIAIVATIVTSLFLATTLRESSERFRQTALYGHTAWLRR